MVRLILAVVIGIVIAVGATYLVPNMLSSTVNGTPSNSTLYNYGTR